VFSGQWEPIDRWYSTERVADDRVAGHSAAVVAVNPRDEHRYRYRLWLEKNTGLLVKSQVLTRDDEVLERFQFTMLKLTNDFQEEEFEIQSAMQTKEFNLDKKTAPRNSNQLTGWAVGWRPEGFSLATAPRARRGQAVAFSDGLASFSVFVRPLDSMDMPAGVSQIGATTVFMRKLKMDESVSLVTVVGEIPPATAMKIAKSVRFNGSSASPQANLETSVE
jgi:sigma-E factor negative regulatory protein RseB